MSHVMFSRLIVKSPSMYRIHSTAKNKKKFFRQVVHMTYKTHVYTVDNTIYIVQFKIEGRIGNLLETT